MYNSTPAAAVEEWLTMFPSLKPLVESEPWFKPMVKAVAAKKFEQSATGLVLRCCALVLLAVVDTCSDAYSIRAMYRSDDPSERQLASRCVGLVCFSFVAAFIVILIQNQRQRKRKIALELLYAVLHVKPGIDSYRVMTGAEDVLCTFSFETEITSLRITEMICESIPTSLFQL